VPPPYEASPTPFCIWLFGHNPTSPCFPVSVRSISKTQRHASEGAGVGAGGFGVGAGGGAGVEGPGGGDGLQHARKTPEDTGQQSPGSAAQPGWALQEALGAGGLGVGAGGGAGVGAGGFGVGAGGAGVGGGVGLGSGPWQPSHRLLQDFCPHW